MRLKQGDNELAPRRTGKDEWILHDSPRLENAMMRLIPSPIERITLQPMHCHAHCLERVRSARWHCGRVTGRFLQEDPIWLNAGDHNVYRYTWNNPVNWTGPDGTARP